VTAGRQELLGARGAWSRYGAAASMRWTNAQQRLFDSPYRLTVAWGCNGGGKSVGVAELTRRALGGELYWQRPKPDGHVVILAGNTWTQLGSTLRYLWKLVDPRWFKKNIRYEGGGLKGQRLAVFDIVDGPGKGGELRLGTFDAENLAGPRADVVITDEPMPESVYNELWPRLFGRGGRMYQTFTPTLGTSAKLDYLWALVDDPARPWAGEIQTPLTLDAVTPRGGRFEIPWATQEEIDQFAAGLSAKERDMRMGLVRTPKSQTAYYSAWGSHLLLDTAPTWWTKACATASPPRVGIGIDHGSKPGAQRVVLASVLGTSPHARVWIMDEYTAEGRTESADDAKGIVEMLQRNGMDWSHVDQWVGDRAHGGDFRGGKKANFYLQQHLAELMGVSTSSRGWMERLPAPLRQIHTPYKRDKSVYEGADILHRLMLKGPEWYAVSSRCVQLDEDHRTWEGGRYEPAKDGCDAERYIVVPMIEGKRH